MKRKIDYRFIPAFIISLIFLSYDIYDKNLFGIIVMGILTLIWGILIIFKVIK